MHNAVKDLWPLLQPIEGIQPDPRNARTHPEDNLEAIKNSIRHYGQRKPIIVNAKTGIIEAGNGLFMAAKALGWTEIAVARVQDDHTDAMGYAIMDNQSALLSAWDMPTLKDQLEELDNGAWDMLLTGFNEASLEELMAQYHIEEIDPPLLQAGDRKGFQQMTFIVSDGQAELIKKALDIAKGKGPFIDTGNENSNGNALARITEEYCGES